MKNRWTVEQFASSSLESGGWGRGRFHNKLFDGLILVMNFCGDKLLRFRKGKFTYFLDFTRIKFWELQLKQNFKKFDFRITLFRESKKQRSFVRIRLTVSRISQKFAKLQNFILAIIYSLKGALSGLRQFMSNWKPFKNDRKCFLFHLKALFVLKIFKFLSCLFGYRNGSIKRQCYFQILWRHSLVKKLFWYTYCPISREVIKIRKWNSIS